MKAAGAGVAAGPPPAAAAPARLAVVIVIARYPPHHVGGYELRCRDVARELAKRGHAVTVLTSREGARGVETDAGVRVVRELHLYPEGVRGGRATTLGFILATGADCRRLRRETRGADVVAYWHQSGLSSALLAVKPRDGCGVLCDVSSEWLRDCATTGGNWFRIWEKPASTGAKRAAKAVLRLFAGVLLGAPVRRPKFPPGRAYFTSADRKQSHLDSGVAVGDAAIIRSGIDLARFRFVAERPPGTLVLFLSRIKRSKGLHTLVLALGDHPQARLRAVGAVEDEGYLGEVAELARAAKTLPRIEFGAPVPHSDVPQLLAGAHVLAFVSEEPEAFSRLVLEAFAVGTPVVGTTIGGTGEVLREGETGLTFAPGNARELSNQLGRLLSDDALRARLVRNARKLVEERYSLGFTVDQIEALLRDAVQRARTPPAPAAEKPARAAS